MSPQAPSTVSDIAGTSKQRLTVGAFVGHVLQRDGRAASANGAPGGVAIDSQESEIPYRLSG
jgi:hypothetical protein